jgi:CheY-like chemotaxis protein
MAKVLIVEDDDVIAQGMARHLSLGGYDPVVVADGDTGLKRLRFETPDVCVVDLMLPRMDGLEADRVGPSRGRRDADHRRQRSRAPSTTACTRSRSERTTTSSSRSR